MDGKLNYPRFYLCKKPDEKTPIRREMTFFAKVSKTAVFAKWQMGDQGKMLKNGRFFEQNSEG